MAFVYSRIVRFQDTDAAGVVYFANVLSLCHEAYEASLAESGIRLREFFRGDGIFAVPIVHAEADYYQPFFCGDRLTIHLTPQRLADYSFEVNYQIFAAAETRSATNALTRHVCVDPRSRAKQPLPNELVQWLQQMIGE